RRAGRQMAGGIEHEGRVDRMKAFLVEKKLLIETVGARLECRGEMSFGVEVVKQRADLLDGCLGPQPFADLAEMEQVFEEGLVEISIADRLVADDEIEFPRAPAVELAP